MAEGGCRVRLRPGRVDQRVCPHTVSDLDDHQTLTRYRPDGGLLWRIPLPYANESRKVAVGRENEIYVATNDEVFQFDWLTTLTKYNSRGTRVWMRGVQDNIGLRLDGLDADDQGNAFLGLTNPDLGQDQPWRVKEFYTYSPGGNRLLYRTFDFGTEVPLVGPAALSPRRSISPPRASATRAKVGFCCASTGEQGALRGSAERGKEVPAYLRKLSSSGNTV